MKNFCENDKYVSTPERKREYICRWLLENPHETAGLNSDSNERTPPNSPKDSEKCIPAFTHPLSPVLSPKPSTSCGQIKSSPILGRKRLASSPVIGGRRKSFKKIKVVKKLNIAHYTKNTESSDSKLETVLKSKTHVDLKAYDSSKNIFDKNSTIASTVKANESELELIFGDSNPLTNNAVQTKRVFQHKIKPFEDTISQLIESVSSTQNTSTDNSVKNIQEASSDTDKTVSDLIEDVSTQVVLVASEKVNVVSSSQKISNPSSTDSPTSVSKVHISETTAAEINTNFNSLETATPTYQIDSISTLESKIDFGKVSYMLQYITEKTKTKRTHLKGGLLDILLTSMAKEKSNVNLFRHQLCRKSDTMCNEKPFILLQIIEYLPMINDSQLLKCALIEDSMNLLNRPLKKNNFVNVINVPEISCLVNSNEKPALKVYEPWTVLDPNQLIIHITRFIAIQPNSEGIAKEKLLKTNFETQRKFHCPCMNENRLSNKCEIKFRDCPHDVVKTVFDYN